MAVSSYKLAALNMRSKPLINAPFGLFSRSWSGSTPSWIAAGLKSKADPYALRGFVLSRIGIEMLNSQRLVSGAV